MKLQRRCFFLCLHSLGNSFLVLSVARCGLHMIKYFSLKHSLHDLVDVVYGSAFANTFQFMVCGMFWSFNVQIYWLSAVLFFFVFVSEGAFVVIISGFKKVFCYAYILFCFVIVLSLNCCLVYYSVYEAVAIQWACVFISAVAVIDTVVAVACVLFSNYCFIMV